MKSDPRLILETWLVFETRLLLGEIGKVDNVAYNSTFAYEHEQAFTLIDIVLWPIFHFSKWRPSAILDF